ncbi:MAG: zinc-ribbon domain-containing protein [Desulfobacterales bacterium]|uniref:Zinc-ribbon domain-containing protein n=1 Tax=Candidatus Desulfaltia bathyphila TaxID=2841697 RepID=A0A8J6N580_9BACT|nr:zinc-ribbon domain-containing protein [Candidatus Desulfaltia bathyphila]MBL7196186.1 zinc-ribbon domain-containing protein [Desulfobacterales bacterium]MBL7207086.1 zinc-ribbon domain-containing protein [Desulfobacterales bacterium]
MIITCEKCYAKFNLDENLLKQTGSKVRCSKCQNIFLAYPPTETEKPAEPAEEMVGSETVDSDVETESVEQVEVSEEEAKGTLETEEEALDLADLNLEEEMEPKPEVKEEPEELPELKLDIEPVAEETPEESVAVLETKEEELDLFDIEKMLDTEEEPKLEAEVKEEPEEIELDLDAEPVAKEEFEEPEREFELADVDKEETKKEVEETVGLGSQADQPEAEEVEKPLEADVKTEEASITTEQETTPDGKKRISTPVLVALIIALLTGGAYGTYVALKSMNIKIPFISDLVEPAVQDEAGNLKIIAFDIADKFVDNSKIGKLFIISGKVKNEYSGARSFIKITGKLYAKERALSKTATVCCGNVLSDQDLSDMDMNSINKRLSNLLGDNKSNVNVKPGKLLPFMIVFPNIPDNIEEYTVEVMGSSPS